MQFTAIAVGLILCIGFVLGSQEFVKLGPDSYLRGNKYIPLYNVEDTTNLVKDALAVSNIPMKDRIAVNIVFSFPIYSNGTHPRLPSLNCALQKLYANIRPYTPMDVFIFVNQSTIDNVPSWLYNDFDGLYVLPIDAKSWELPATYSSIDLWTCGNFGLDYHLMGRWGLTFGPDFARSLGYKYLLLIDDDSIFVQDAPFTRNLVDIFDEHHTAMAYRDIQHYDLPKVSEGLPEIAKYWMVTRNVSAPWGPLLEDMTPPTMEGLSSKNWNMLTFASCFYMLNLDFFYEPPVQDFLSLVLTVGGDMTQRWIDQSTLNMIRLLFVPKENLYLFPQGSMIHEKIKDPRIFRLLQCDSAKQLQEAQQEKQYYQIDDVRNEIKTIEFVVLMAHSGRTHDLKEMYLFHWMYNTSSCGADTFALNNYARFEEELMYMPIFDWWYESDVDGRMATMLARAHGGSTILSPPAGPQSAAAATVTRCQQVLRQQLEDYVNFYCVFTGTHLGNPMARNCESIRRSTLSMIEQA